MDLEAFNTSPTGRLVPIDVEQRGETVPYFAFVPEPLPADLDLASRTWETVVEATAALAELRTLAEDRLPNPVLIGRATVRREAVSTSALEGTYAPARRVLASEMDDESPRDAGVTEILNYVGAWEDAAASTLPICVRLACQLQDRLVRGTPSEDYQTGAVRETQVLIGPYRGCSIEESAYVPPPPGDHLSAGLTSWEKWLHESTCNEVVKVALAHYQFEALHPFTDGNGRIGRLLAILQLIRAGLIPGPLVNLSPYFEARSEQYRHRLRAVSTKGEIDEWIQFFAAAIGSQASEAQTRIRSLLAWRDETVEYLRSRGRKGSVVDLIPHLVEYPVINVKHAQVLLGVSNPSANSAVNALAALGIIQETTGGTYNRVFEVTAVLDIIFGP